MTQDYLNHLFENYPQGDVPKFYWTADGTAFKSIDDAMKYANRLTDPTVKTVAHGGKLEDALTLEDGLEQDAETGDVNVGAVTQGDVANISIAKLKKEQLQKLCDLRGVVYDAEMTKAPLIKLLEEKANTDATNVTVDYNTMDLEQLQALCKERAIDVTGAVEDAEKLTAFLQEWDVKNATEVTE